MYGAYTPFGSTRNHLPVLEKLLRVVSTSRWQTPVAVCKAHLVIVTTAHFNSVKSERTVHWMIIEHMHYPYGPE